MTAPAFADLARGHVVLAPDPFKTDDDATRPWVIVNSERHPFDGEQYVAMGMTTRTWHEHRVPLDPDDFRHRSAPRDSSILPHAVTSPTPNLLTDYVCRARDEPLDRAVEQLRSYL